MNFTYACHYDQFKTLGLQIKLYTTTPSQPSPELNIEIEPSYVQRSIIAAENVGSSAGLLAAAA
jgi:hypothetical protein